MTMIHTANSRTTSIEESETFWSAAFDDAREATLSIDRCIDWLLDLYQSTTHAVLRELVSDVLDDLRAVGCEGIGFAALDLDDVVLGALASIETAFEIYR